MPSRIAACAMSDIEDLIPSEERLPAHRSIVWKSSRRRAAECTDQNGIDISPFIDNIASIFVKTWGCSHNNSDGEYMQGQLLHAGFTIVESMEECDLAIFNSCTVKDPSEAVFINAIASAQSRGKFVVLAGCVPQGDQSNKTFKNLSVIGVQQIDRVVEVVQQTLDGNVVRLLSRSKMSGGAQLDLPKIRRNRFIEILPINTGCLNQCTYCKTKHSRGELSSYPPEEIVARARQVIAEGVREIWLSSEDTGAYGHDIGTSLPDMLWQLIAVIPAGVFLRIGMTNPPHILAHLGEMAAILRHPRVFSFLHIPVQSGSTRVLEKMRRDYTIEDFRVVVDVLRDRVPDLQIATDIICGFPTETDIEFEASIALINEYRFPALHISQFYARRGTPAAHMERLASGVIKERSRAISKAFNAYETHTHQIGKEYDVICTERAADNAHLVAHNKSYDQILVCDDEERLMGKCFRVRITSTDKFFMRGDVIPGSIKEGGVPDEGGSEGDLPAKTASGDWAHRALPIVSFILLLLAILIHFNRGVDVIA